MTTIEEASCSQLRNELSRRKKEVAQRDARRLALASCAPKLLDTIDTSEIVECCAAYRDFVTSSNYHEDRQSDYEHAITDAALLAVFGPEFWEWFNKATE